MNFTPRYEWSVGITDSDEPEGIIDGSVENVWHPCGQIDYAVYTLPRGSFTKMLKLNTSINITILNNKGCVQYL